MSFFSSRTRRGDIPRILAVSSAVGNRELIRTPITPLYTRIPASSALMFSFLGTSHPRLALAFTPPHPHFSTP